MNNGKIGVYFTEHETGTDKTENKIELDCPQNSDFFYPD